MQTSELPALVDVPPVGRITEGGARVGFRVTVLDVGEFVMRKAGGVALILSGVAVGVYGIVEPWQLEATLSKASTAELPARPATQVPEPRPWFWPSASTELPTSGWTPLVVTIPPRGSNPGTSSQQPAIPKDRDTLARELQKELKRVGCYVGELNGAWSPSTRRAMKMFIDRVNASLPVEEPDPILYAMVRGERDQVCGQACQVGERLTQDGRCVPTAILAKANGRAPTLESSITSAEKPRTITGWSVTNTALDTPPSTASDSSRSPSMPIEGRMALAGPSAYPIPATATLTPRPRAVHRGAPTVSPPFAGGGQSWSRAIFNSRLSNN
jgi:hypothetical protein